MYGLIQTQTRRSRSCRRASMPSGSGKTRGSHSKSHHWKAFIQKHLLDDVEPVLSDVKADLADGKLDLVIGTHRILGNEVKFKDLGLVIIDEEQRFGVEHKEQLKALRTNVDVLAMSATPIPRTLEMAVTGEMIELACRARPTFACLVPERREEVTTEGGLDVVSHLAAVRDACQRLLAVGTVPALFIDADEAQLAASLAAGAPQIEIHTGRYADTAGEAQRQELTRIRHFASQAQAAGLEVHAGHGLHLQNVAAIARIPEVVELNIGHSIVARAIFVGLPAAVAEMRRVMTEARRLAA